MAIYTSLKSNIMKEVCYNYYNKGFFFENFDCQNGMG